MMARQKTLLLVEDEYLLACRQRQGLEDEGYRVLHAASGEEALAAVDADESIDLVLMDINLGKGMDGTQAAGLILERHELPLLFLSSHTEKEVVQKTEGITNYGYVTKDAGLTVLDASIKMALKLFASKSALKESCAQLVSSEARFSQAFQNAPIGISLTEFDGRLSTVNQAFCDMLGYSMDEVNAGTFMDLTHPDDIALSLERTGRLRGADCESVRFQKRYLHRDGHVVWVDISMAKMRDDRGEPRNFIAHVVDITRQKLQELALSESESKLRKAQELAHIGIWKRNFDTNELSWSDETYRIFGVDKSCASGDLWKVLMESILPEDRDKIPEMARRAIAGEATQAFDFKIRRRDKSIRIIRTEFYDLVKDEKGRVLGIEGLAQDITERARLEERERAEAELFYSMFQHISATSLLVDPKSGAILDANKAASDYYGYPLDALKKMRISDINTLPPDEIGKEMEKAVAASRSYFNFRHRLSDGRVREVEVHSSPLEVRGKTLLHSIVHDITDRKELQERLLASESKLRAILENSRDAIGVHVQGIWVTCNPAALEMFGVSSEDELLGEPIVGVILPSERERILDYVKRRTAGLEAPSAYVTKGLRKDGSVFDLEVDLSSYMLEGRRHTLVILRDISEREEAAKALRESEERYRLLFENMNEGFALQEAICDGAGVAVDFRFLAANPAYEAQTGQRLQDIIGKTMLEVMPKADRGQIERYGRVALTGEPLSFEYRSRTYDRYFRVRAFRPQAGRFATIFEDISEAKKAELGMRTALDELHATIATITAGVSRIKDRRIVAANPAHDAVFGYPEGETLGMETVDFFPDPESHERFETEAYPRLDRGETFAVERLMKRKNGELFWCSLTGRLVSRDSPDQGAIWMIRDISDRKRSEAELQGALRENQRLLHELQHRAKNSFGMISGMISLATTEDIPEQALTALKGLDDRVRAVAELYSLLYASNSAEEVRLDDYIARVAESMVGLSSRISLVTRLEGLSVAAQKAAPIGLITTELITNALKYAFPEGRTGTITVKLSRSQSQTVLEVEDDGIGLPQGFKDSASPGMGMKIVAGLVRQIGGRFDISNAGVGSISRVLWESRGDEEGRGATPGSVPGLQSTGPGL